jgi:hypothetical protein
MLRSLVVYSAESMQCSLVVYSAESMQCSLVVYKAESMLPCVLSAESMLLFAHRVDRVLGCFFSRPNWDPHPLPRKRVCPLPHWFQGEGGAHSEGVVPIRTRGQTLWYSGYICTCTLCCCLYSAESIRPISCTARVPV